jgi:hypothetical protein
MKKLLLLLVIPLFSFGQNQNFSKFTKLSDGPYVFLKKLVEKTIINYCFYLQQ